MRRRRFVTTAGIVGVSALAGCVSEDGNGDNGGTSQPPDERIDEPPHDPERPPVPNDEDDWNDHWLGEGMATEPSLPFESVRAELVDPKLGGPPPHPNSEFVATLATSDEELESLIDLEDAPEQLQTVDFAEELVIVVESGYGSSSLQHVWQRVEDIDSGVYLHGYYLSPYIRTDDISPRHSVVVVETPAEEGDIAHVSLTTGEDTRVNFDSSEGVVSISRD